MKFIDLAKQYKSIEGEINARINNVLEHGQYIVGPEVTELEGKLAKFVDVSDCIGVSSGTDALLIALMALDIQNGDEVIVPAFTFVATAEVVSLLGAKPVFADIDRKTYNIDPESIKKCITSKTKAIIAVSMFGQSADFESINCIARDSGLPVIEDGAQSLGAMNKGRASCGQSTIGTTSFFPSKPLGGYGDGGAIFTNDSELALKMRQISRHGQDRRYHHAYIGVNGRLDTLQAAILLAKFDVFQGEIEKRQKVAAYYNDKIRNEINTISIPTINAGNRSVYAQYTIEVAGRDRVQAELAKHEIPTAVHYPITLNRQPAFLDESAIVPNSESAAQKVMSLPMGPYMVREEQDKVLAALKDALVN